MIEKFKYDRKSEIGTLKGQMVGPKNWNREY